MKANTSSINLMELFFGYFLCRWYKRRFKRNTYFESLSQFPKLFEQNLRVLRDKPTVADTTKVSKIRLMFVSTINAEYRQIFIFLIFMRKEFKNCFVKFVRFYSEYESRLIIKFFSNDFTVLYT
ncbi:hypothetical protein BpHYR1_023906 [Brachionus plicatilis]|uniref:Uncharacterized protein n=1 Tax=Brachionus plicatilis TaxID=10195 RepID=A0A3M7R5L5_BRAPC|nr:hypothetical protein BpHYR1_023906 [Brachionus plicatilis]